MILDDTCTYIYDVGFSISAFLVANIARRYCKRVSVEVISVGVRVLGQ